MKKLIYLAVILAVVVGLICFFEGEKTVAALNPSLSRVAGLQLGAGGDASGLAISGNYAFAGKGNKVYVIDISTPTNPVVKTQVDVGANVVSLAVAGNYLYAGTGINNSGPEFRVINISNPLSPSIAGSLELGAGLAGTQDIAVAGNFAYVGTTQDGTGYDDPGGALNEFHVINVSNPSSPSEVGGINPDTFDKNGYSIISVAVSGTHAYVGRGSGYDSRNAFSVIDIANPSAPSVVSSTAFGTSISGFSVSALSHYAYVGIYDANGINDFSIVDTTNPSVPALLKNFTLGNRITALFTSGKYAYAGNSVLHIFDISTPENAAKLDEFNVGSLITGVNVSGNYAYTTSWNNANGNFQVIDVSAVTMPDGAVPGITLAVPGGNPLSGNITLSAAASDNIRVANVRFKYNGNNIGDPVTISDLTSPFTKAWNTAGVSDGSCTLTAVATDTSGNTAVSNSVLVTVNNSGGDHIAPAVSITMPSQNETDANAILVKADATDNFAVSSVQFKLDGSNLGSPITSPPYKVAWDTTMASNGSHTLTSVATDSSNNQKTSAGVSMTVDNSHKWFTDFTPQHEFFVSPSGNGNGSSENSPMSLVSAVSSANPGDLFWLLEGTYNRGVIELNRDGTSDHPIVFRARPGQHAHINGHIKINGDYTWVWGLEVTDTGKISSSGGIGFFGTGVRAINNVIHDLWGGGNTIDTSNVSAGQVAYGNILYGGTDTPLEQRSHLVYPQNTFSEYGYKYFVNNMFLDPPKNACNLVEDANGHVISAQDCFAFHAYSTSALVQGMNLRNNIFANGRFLIGGFGLPADREIVKNNYFYNSGPQFGYRRPTQAECRDNYIGKGSLSASWWWGEGEVQYAQAAPNIFSGNEVYSSSGGLLDLRTSAYTSAGRQEGIPSIQKSDLADNNKYSSPFAATLEANGSARTDIRSFDGWKTQTAAAGNQFDANSQVVSFPSSEKVFVVPNEYENDRGNIAVYNWDHGSSVSADLSSVLENGDAYYIYDAKDAFGTPRASVIYNGGSVSIPTGGAEFLPLIVTSTAHYSSADINTDLSVNVTDFNLLKSDFLKLTANLANSRSDIDGDGQTTIKDVGIMMSGWR